MANLPSWKDLQAEFQNGVDEHGDLFAERDYKDEWVFPPNVSPRTKRIFTEIAARAVHKLALQGTKEFWQLWLEFVDQQGWRKVPIGNRSANATAPARRAPWTVTRNRIERMERQFTSIFQRSAACCQDLAERDEPNSAARKLPTASDAGASGTDRISAVARNVQRGQPNKSDAVVPAQEIAEGATSSLSNHRLNTAVGPRGKNPFPEGTRAHQSWIDTSLLAKEELALLHAEMQESMPPEEASEKEFLAHILKMETREFDIWALAFWRFLHDSPMLADEAARFFENLLGQLEEAAVARASTVYVPFNRFIPKKLLLSEIRTLSIQRGRYWAGRILKEVREQKEASRAKAAAPKGDGGEPRVANLKSQTSTGNPILDEIYAAGNDPETIRRLIANGGANLSPAAQEAIRMARGNLAGAQPVSPGVAASGNASSLEGEGRVQPEKPKPLGALECISEAMTQLSLNSPKLTDKVHALLKRKRVTGLKADRTTVFRVVRGNTKWPNPALRDALIEVLQLPADRAAIVRNALTRPQLQLANGQKR
jgi:hypothetical protein